MPPDGTAEWAKSSAEKECKSMKNDATTYHKKEPLPPWILALEFEKSMTEQARRKEAKRCEKDAVDPSWCL